MKIIYSEASMINIFVASVEDMFLFDQKESFPNVCFFSGKNINSKEQNKGEK